MGYQEVIINKVPCISCEHGNHRPTPSTAPSLQYKTHPRTETFHYTSELIEDFWQRLRLGEETVLSAFKLRGIEHQGNKEFIPKNWRECRSRRARTKQLVRDVPPVQEAPRKVRDSGTRASRKRTLSRGMKAAREGTPQNVSYEYFVLNYSERSNK